jgi:hypothetical protein
MLESSSLDDSCEDHDDSEAVKMALALRDDDHANTAATTAVQLSKDSQLEHGDGDDQEPVGSVSSQLERGDGDVEELVASVTSQLEHGDSDVEEPVGSVSSQLEGGDGDVVEPAGSASEAESSDASSSASSDSEDLPAAISQLQETLTMLVQVGSDVLTEAERRKLYRYIRTCKNRSLKVLKASSACNHQFCFCALSRK